MIKKFEQFCESKKDDEIGLPNGFDNISEIPLKKRKTPLKDYIETNSRKEPRAATDVETKEVGENPYKNSIYSEEEFLKYNKKLAIQTSHRGFTAD